MLLRPVMAEVMRLRHALDREGRRDALLGVISRLTQECQCFTRLSADSALYPTREQYDEWIKKGERDIARYSRALATEWTEMSRVERTATVHLAFRERLARLGDLHAVATSSTSRLPKMNLARKPTETA